MVHLEEEQRDLLLAVLSEVTDSEVIPPAERAQIREILEEADDDEVALDVEQVAFLRDAVEASEELGLDERVDILSILDGGDYDEDDE